MRKFKEYNLRVEDIAKMLVYNVEYARKLAKKGKIPGLKIGGRWRFNEAEIMAHARRMTEVSRTGEKYEDGDDAMGDLLL